MPLVIDKIKRTYSIEKYRRRVALISALGVVSLALFLQIKLSGVAELAYPAIFVISLIGNATLMLPAPTLLSVCEGGITLNPILVGTIAGFGQALGEITGYIAGFAGSGVAKRSRIYNKIQPWVKHRGWIAVMGFSVIPNPVFDVIGLASGAIGMPLWQFLTATLIGKTIRSIGIAYACSAGFDPF